ncbi:MAG TPA: PorV/PorQ family protein [Spirochaetota bacterium]|nr:PorV/PorQ family protein [Spirochaetota bacterium]
MKKSSIKRIIILFMITLTCLIAQNTSGLNSLAFLKLPKSANAASLAEAVTGIRGDVFSLFYNPAGVFSAKIGQDYMLNYTRLHGQMNYFTGAAKVKFERIGDLGVGARFLVPGEQQGTKLEGGELVETSTFQNVNFEITANYSRSFLRDRLLAGANIKTAVANLGNKTTDRLPALVMDFGGIFNFGLITPFLHSLNLGVSVNNVGFQLGDDAGGTNKSNKDYPLPTKIHGGLSYLWWINSQHELLFCGDAETLFAGKDTAGNYLPEFKFLTAVRYTFNKMLSASVGYKIGEGKSGFKAGIGFSWKGLNVNYGFAYREMDQYNIINSIDIGYSIKHKKKPINVDALYFAGQKAFAKKEYEKAEELYNQVVKLKPDYKDAKARLDEIKKIRQKQKRLKMFEQAMQEIE